MFMNNFKRVAISVFCILLLSVIFFSINCGTGTNPTGGGETEVSRFTGYVYAPADEEMHATGVGLSVLTSSTAPTGYTAVEGAKVYPEDDSNNAVYSDADGQFAIELDSGAAEALSRNIGNGTKQIIIEPPPGLTHIEPIRHIIAPQNKNGDYKKLILHPNARNIKAGQVIQLYAMGVLEGSQNEFIDPSLITWQVDDGSIGIIDSSGVFTGLSAGTAMVTITYDSLSCTGRVFVRGINDENFTLSGVVTDKSANPVSNAVVVITGMDTVSITSSDGSYSISNVPGNINLAVMAYINGQVRYSSLIHLTEDTVHNIVIENTAVLTGSLEGTVTSNQDGQPVKNVLITIGDWSTTTDSSGVYLISNIPKGTYSVSFDKSGYVSHTTNQEIEAGSTALLNVVLEKIVVITTGTITGSVRDQEGEGIAGAQVSYTNIAAASSLVSRISTLTGLNPDKKYSRGAATTDLQGNFSFTEVAAGTYRVSASKDGYVENYEDVTVIAGGESDVTIILQQETITPIEPPLDPCWMNVGNPGFSEGGAVYTSLFMYDGTPYVAYKDDGNGGKATVMKFNGTNWVNVGNAGFSADIARYTSLFIDDAGTPYVAYTDEGNGHKASVMKFNGSEWVYVGTPGFSVGETEWTAIFIDDSGTPYIVFTDFEHDKKATVMKYDGDSWIIVGEPGFSAGTVGHGASIFIRDSGLPYVTYKDGGNDGKASVMKYDGSNWVHVGTPGLSENEAWGPSIFIDDSGAPYVAYSDWQYIGATVAKFDGDNWVYVGSPGFSDGDIGFIKLFIDNTGAPYVAYRDGANDCKITVMKHNNSNWVNVGSTGFSADAVWHPSLFVDDTGIPYVAYKDTAYEGKATVMKFDVPIVWSRCYGGSEDDIAHSIIQTCDGGYIAVGYTHSSENCDVTGKNNGEADIWVLKVNKNGEIEWERNYGGSEDDRAYSVAQTYDGGYIVAGHTLSSANGDVSGTSNSIGKWDVWILKLNENGDLVWEKNYGGSHHDYARSVQQTLDGGYIVAGLTYSSQSGDINGVNNGGADVWVLKLYEDGEIEWERNYGGSLGDVVLSIKQTSEGGYIAAGYTYSSESGDVSGVNNGEIDYWILKISENGVLEWEKNYGGAASDNGWSIQETFDGGYIVAGYTYSSQSGDVSGANNGERDVWILKLSENGEIEWEKNYGGPGDDIAYSIQQIAGGKYVIAALTRLSENGNAWILKLDENGSIEWDRTYGGSGYDTTWSIRQTLDGGYVAAGYTSSSENGDVTDTNCGGYDFWIIKLDGNGKLW
jgi:hypothetical protein